MHGCKLLENILHYIAQGAFLSGYISTNIGKTRRIPQTLTHVTEELCFFFCLALIHFFFFFSMFICRHPDDVFVSVGVFHVKLHLDFISSHRSQQEALTFFEKQK